MQLGHVVGPRPDLESRPTGAPAHPPHRNHLYPHRPTALRRRISEDRSLDAPAHPPHRTPDTHIDLQPRPGAMGRGALRHALRTTTPSTHTDLQPRGGASRRATPPTLPQTQGDNWGGGSRSAHAFSTGNRGTALTAQQSRPLRSTGDFTNRAPPQGYPQPWQKISTHSQRSSTEWGRSTRCRR